MGLKKCPYCSGRGEVTIRNITTGFKETQECEFCKEGWIEELNIDFAKMEIAILGDLALGAENVKH